MAVQQQQPTQIHNPLDDYLGNISIWGYLNQYNPVTNQFEKAEKQPGDILGIDAAIKSLEKTFNDNAPSYAVAVFGLILIGAGVYSLAK